MQELNKFAEKLMGEKGVESYDLNIEGLIGKGEGYLGEVIFFNITPKNGGNPIHFVKKRAKYVNGAEEEKIVRLVYQRETLLYKVVFPGMKTFLHRQGKNVALDFIPKVYHIVEELNQEMLVFENMKYSGYELLDKKNPLGHVRVCEVLKTLAKFHGLSFAMKELEPETFKSITKDMGEIWNNFKCIFGAEQYFGELLKNVLIKLAEDGREDLMTKFKPILDDIQNVVYPEVAEEDRLVVCHGDAWTNNMLFRIKDRESSQPVCLIDFQISSLHSPALDVSTFLLGAGNGEVLNDIENYMKIYYDFLFDFLNNYSCDIAVIFPYRIFLEHWNKYAKTGLAFALYIIQACLTEVDEVPDELNALASDSSNMKNQDSFHERVRDLLDCFGDKFL